MNEEDVLKAIRTYFAEKGFIEKVTTRWKKRPDLLFENSERVAIEAKGSNYDGYGALEQCLHYQKFANKVYVAFPFDITNKIIFEPFKTLGIGVLIVGQNKNVKIVNEARLNPTPLLPKRLEISQRPTIKQRRKLSKFPKGELCFDSIVKMHQRKFYINITPDLSEFVEARMPVHVVLSKREEK